MASYYPARFTRMADVTDLMPANKSDYTSKMQQDMNYVEQNNGNANGGRWHIAKCISVNGLDSNGARDEYYLVYYPAYNLTPVPNPKTVAAPCPPFCQDETSGILDERLTKIEELLAKMELSLLALQKQEGSK